MRAMSFLVAGLLIWAFTESEAKLDLKPSESSISLTCSVGGKYTYVGGEVVNATNLRLDYRDDQSGECVCDKETMSVKFRTCDNCMELDYTALTLVAVGNVLAIIMIGVAVYRVALHLASRSCSSSSSAKKDSGRQPLLQNDHDGHYQPLKPRVADEYSRLPNRH